MSLVILMTCTLTVHAKNKPVNTSKSIKKTFSVVGKLIDKEGKPEPGVLVTALFYKGMRNGNLKTIPYFCSNGRLPESRTDDKGRFMINDIPSGKWVFRTSSGPFDKGDFIRIKNGKNSIVLIVELGKKNLVDIGTVHLN